MQETIILPLSLLRSFTSYVSIPQGSNIDSLAIQNILAHLQRAINLTVAYSSYLEHCKSTIAFDYS